MRVAIGLLTYNRLKLFERTLASLRRTEYPFQLAIVDNGSTDGTAERVRELGGHCNKDGNHTAGHGMNLVIGAALNPVTGLKFQPDLVVFTADDYEYQEGWLERLVQFWSGAKKSMVLATLNLEPDYDWNQARGVVECRGVRGLLRDSAPGSQWSFRAVDWSSIGPVRETTGGEDLEICRRLRGQGRGICALDLSEHIGERESAWGNQSWRVGRRLERERWGM